MDLPRIITLEKLGQSPAFSIKLNNDILNHFNILLKQNLQPKLLVKDGKFSIKIDDDTIFPCSQQPEYQNLDIYLHNKNDTFNLTGKIKTRLSVDDKIRTTAPASNLTPGSTPISRPNPVKKTGNIASTGITQSTPATPLNFDPYLALPSDSKSDLYNKILCFLALGPTSRDRLVNVLKFKSADVDEILPTHCQVYNPKDNFLASDVFPNHYISTKPDETTFILKDKSYKELRPWSWKYYSDNERSCILANINNALTRLGYLETHPLRRKIVEPDTSIIPSKNTHKRNTSGLGGGILISSKKSPFKKSQTESPRLAPTAGSSTVVGSPLKAGKKRVNSSSSSDEDKQDGKRFKPEITSPSSVNEDTDDEADKSKSNYYTTLTTKFRVRYKEYEELYNQLNRHNSNDPKKAINKLFELHQSLKDWKRQIWHYDKEIKAKAKIMNLSKHKKKETPTTVEVKTKKPVKPVLNY